MLYAGMVACANAADAPAANAPAAVTSAAPNIAFKSNPNPPRSGDNAVEVTVTNADGSPVNGVNVSATFYMPAMPSMSMPEMRSVVSLTDQGKGFYHGTAQLVMSGTWEVTVNVMRGNEKLGSKKLTVIAK